MSDDSAIRATTALILEIFRANGALLAAGDRLVGEIGLTSARWQVLGAATLAAEPPTVARIAREMGQTRQGVQRTVNDLLRLGLVELAENPHHRRARLVTLTEAGRSAFAAASARQAPWAAAIGRGLDPGTLDTARTLLRTLGDRATNAGRMPETEET